MLPIFPSSKLMVFVWQKKKTYLHLVQIIWNNLVVLVYLSVHTDVSISCLFLCTYTCKYFHNVHYFPPSVSSFLPQSVELKSISEPFSVYSTVHMLNKRFSSTAQWGRTSLKCWKTHWCWSDSGFLIAVVSKGTPLHKWLVLKGNKVLTTMNYYYIERFCFWTSVNGNKNNFLKLWSWFWYLLLSKRAF